MDYANFLLASLPQKNQDSSCIDSSLTSGSYSRSYSSSTTPCKDLHQSTYGSEFNSTSMAILAFALGPEALELCLQPREEGRRRAPHQSRPSFNIYTYIHIQKYAMDDFTVKPIFCVRIMSPLLVPSLNQRNSRLLP